MRLLLLWVGALAAAVAVGIAWAWLLGVIGPTYVWSIAVILIGVYCWCRARTQSDKSTTLFITASILGILLAAGILNVAG
jgi:ABC-type Mn2+/Zn2+ transport system permease subunit